MKAIVLALLLSVSGCSVWDFIKPSSGLSVDTEIVAGDKAINTEVVNEKTTTHNTADSISQVFNTINEDSNWITLGVVTILGWFVGWITKTPIGMFNLFKRAFRRNKNA